MNQQRTSLIILLRWDYDSLLVPVSESQQILLNDTAFAPHRINESFISH